MLYQQRNVVEKQWKKVSTKDDYDTKPQQYIKEKENIEKIYEEFIKDKRKIENE